MCVYIYVYVSFRYFSFLPFFIFFFPFTLSLSIASRFFTSSSVAHMQKSIEIDFFLFLLLVVVNARSYMQNLTLWCRFNFSSDLFWSTNKNAILSSHIQCVRVQRLILPTHYFLCACYDFSLSSSFHFNSPQINLLLFMIFMWNYVKLYDKVFIWLLLFFCFFFFDWRCSNRNRSHSDSKKKIEEKIALYRLYCVLRSWFTEIN